VEGIGGILGWSFVGGIGWLGLIAVTAIPFTVSATHLVEAQNLLRTIS